MSQALRAQLAACARDLHDLGWVAHHEGNVTVRDGARFWATPTATSKRRISERNLVELDAGGKPVGGGKAFGELTLHLALYPPPPPASAPSSPPPRRTPPPSPAPAAAPAITPSPGRSSPRPSCRWARWCRG